MRKTGRRGTHEPSLTRSPLLPAWKGLPTAGTITTSAHKQFSHPGALIDLIELDELL